jgi:hypothetical protein
VSDKVAELINKWREPSSRADSHLMRKCADELESILPARDQERDAQRDSEHDGVPGMWICPTCEFQLTKSWISPDLMKVAINREDNCDLCPNDGSRLIQLSWKKACENQEKYIADMLKRQDERDAATRLATLDAVAVCVDETIRDEFREGHASADGPRSEIVAKYTRRAILALRTAPDLAWLERVKAQARAEAVEQCAVEAGERSPEGVSSHTMLGDMWDERIAALRKAAAKPVEGGESTDKTSAPQSAP